MKTKYLNLFLFFMLVIGCINLTTFNDNMIASAYQDGSYYVEDFESYVAGDCYINSSIGGNVWVSIIPDDADECYGVTVVDKAANPLFYMADGREWDGDSYRSRQYRPTYTSSTWANFSGNTDYIRFNTSFSSKNGNHYIYIYDSLDAYMGVIKMHEYSGTRQIHICDEDNVIVGNDGVANDGGSAYTFQVEFKVYFHTGNSSIEIEIYDWNDNGNLSDNMCWTPDNFDYPSGLRLSQALGASTYLYIDGLTVEEFDINYLWEIDYDSYGDVSLSHTGVIADTNEDYSVFECQKDNWNQNTYIKQVAVRLVSDDADTSYNCRVGDIALGLASTRYTDPINDGYSIYVWENVNQWVNDTDILVEFVGIKSGSTPLTYILYRDADIDGDGDKGLYHSNDVSDYNGYFYENQNYDLCYQVWYVSEYAYNPHGGVETDNESVCSGISNILEYMNQGYKHIEFRGTQKVSRTIKAFDLYVGEEQYDLISSDESKYLLYVNGHYYNNPDYWIPTGNGYILRWTGIDEDLENENPLFELTCWAYYDDYTTIPFQQVHWNLARVPDNIYFPSYKHHNVYDYSRNGIYDAAITTLTDTIGFCYWYEDIDTPIPPSTPDEVRIAVNPKTGNHSYTTHQYIPITGTISTTAHISYLRLYKDGVRYTKGDWGGIGRQLTGTKLLNGPFFQTGFVADSDDLTGSWNITLVRNNEFLDDAYFNTTELPTYLKSGHIWTEPFPSGKTFTVNWLYSKSENDDKYGAILYNYDGTFSQNDEKLITDLETNGSRSFTTDIDEGNIYFYLCTYYNGGYHVLLPYTHIVGTASGSALHTDKSLYYLDDYEDGVVPVRIFGEHSLYGDNVFILQNGNQIRPVGLEPFFDFIKDYYSTGTYTLRLVYWDGTLGEYEDLTDSISFDIVAGSEGDIQDGDPDAIFTENFDFFMGFGLLIVLTLIGVGISTKLDAEPATYTIIIFALMGAMVSTVMGFFDLWIPFLIGMVLVAKTVHSMIKG